MALNEPKQFWFTNSESKKLMHKWRTEEQGILVGKNTVEVDDCELTARLWKGENPVRMVINQKLSLPVNRKIFNGETRTLIFNEIKNEDSGTNIYVQIDFTGNVIEQILAELYKRNIISVTVEGGPTTLAQFIFANLWDEARIFSTPHILNSGKPAPILTLSLIHISEPTRPY